MTRGPGNHACLGVRAGLGVRAVLAIAALGACSGDATDPCTDRAGACITVRVDPAAGETARLDTLELDLLYAGIHQTVASAPATPAALPAELAVAFEITEPTSIGIVVAGTRGGTVLGTAARTLALNPAEHAILELELAAPATCTAGTLYCGGHQLVGSADTLYACNPTGAPHARGICPLACRVGAVTGAVPGDGCRGAGGCVTGGFYCGGDKLDGDPQSLYRCTGGSTGTLVRTCDRGCAINAGTDDACR